MEHTSALIDPLSAQEINELALHAEEQALEEAAAAEADIGDVRGFQRHKVQELMEKQVGPPSGPVAALSAVGDDGASLAGDLPGERIAQVQQEADRQSDERDSRFRFGGKVSEMEGNQVGEERDNDRSVRFAPRVVSVQAAAGQSREADIHEHQHTLQKTSNDAGAVPQTGAQEVDQLLKVAHTAYREDNAMDAAGDRFTSPRYRTDYKKPVARVRAFLHRNGERGDALVKAASEEGKMREVRQAIIRAHVRRETAEAMRTEAAGS